MDGIIPLLDASCLEIGAAVLGIRGDEHFALCEGTIVKTRNDIVDQVLRHQRDYDRLVAQLQLIIRQKDEVQATLMLLAQEKVFMMSEAARLSEELERLPEQDQRLRHVRHAVVESAAECDHWLCVDRDAHRSAARAAMEEIAQRRRTVEGEVVALHARREDMFKNIVDSLAALQKQVCYIHSFGVSL